jgi:hypothetical protein
MTETRTKKSRKPGGGRKKKNAETVRSVLRGVRFTKDEMQRIESHLKRLGKSFTDYARPLWLNPKIATVPEKKFDVKMILALFVKVGIQINQIARDVNNQYTQHDLKKIEQELAAISNELSETYKEVTK